MYVYKCICMYLYLSLMHVCSSFSIMFVLVSSCIICICMYWYVSLMHVCSSFISLYVLVSSCMYLQLKATWDQEAIYDEAEVVRDGYSSVFQSQYHAFIDLMRRSRVVIGPYHGPGVDVVQLAAGPRAPLTVAHAPRVSGLLVTGHASGNRSIITRREQGQTAEDVRERNHVHNRIGSGHVQHLGPDFRCAGPPNPALGGKVVEEDLDQGALTLHVNCMY
jgi:hypothetical protein